MGGTFDWFGPESHPDFCGNPETGEYQAPLSSPGGGEDRPLSNSPRGGEDSISSGGLSSGNAALPPTGGAGRGASRAITPEQFEHRMILRRAMLAHGFKPFDTEWWHFTLKDEPFPDTYFTFPVKQLNK